MKKLKIKQRWGGVGAVGLRGCNYIAVSNYYLFQIHMSTFLFWNWGYFSLGREGAFG